MAHTDLRLKLTSGPGGLQVQPSPGAKTTSVVRANFFSVFANKYVAATPAPPFSEYELFCSPHYTSPVST